MKVLATGGAGYIGSHTAVELLNAGHDVVVLDDLSNAKPEVLRRIEEITGRKPVFRQCDVRDGEALDAVFRENEIDAVSHFAGRKAVGESLEKPLEYYETNVSGTVTL